MALRSPLSRPPLRRRELRRRQARRRRLAALLSLCSALLLALVLVPWAADKVRGLGRANPHGARVIDLKIESDAVGITLHATVVVPKDAGEHPPLLVFLHGRGGDHDTFLGDQSMFTALSRLGPRAPVVAFPDGGDHGYWHNRAGARWGDYVMGEVVPAAARATGADPKRLAIGGISMGGFGAFDLALKHPGRFCAVGGHSPALWRSAGETAPGAFDDAADFARNDVIAAARHGGSAFLGFPLWLDAGNRDPFQPGDRALVAALRRDGAQLSAHTSWPGGHVGAYWDRHWLAYFRFYTQALGACHPSG